MMPGNALSQRENAQKPHPSKKSFEGPKMRAPAAVGIPIACALGCTRLLGESILGPQGREGGALRRQLWRLPSPDRSVRRIQPRGAHPDTVHLCAERSLFRFRAVAARGRCISRRAEEPNTTWSQPSATMAPADASPRCGRGVGAAGGEILGAYHMKRESHPGKREEETNRIVSASFRRS